AEQDVAGGGDGLAVEHQFAEHHRPDRAETRAHVAEERGLALAGQQRGAGLALPALVLQAQVALDRGLAGVVAVQQAELDRALLAQAAQAPLQVLAHRGRHARLHRAGVQAQHRALEARALVPAAAQARGAALELAAERIAQRQPFERQAVPPSRRRGAGRLQQRPGHDVVLAVAHQQPAAVGVQAAEAAQVPQRREQVRALVDEAAHPEQRVAAQHAHHGRLRALQPARRGQHELGHGERVRPRRAPAERAPLCEFFRAEGPQRSPAHDHVVQDVPICYRSPSVQTSNAPWPGHRAWASAADSVKLARWTSTPFRRASRPRTPTPRRCTSSATTVSRTGCRPSPRWCRPGCRGSASPPPPAAWRCCRARAGWRARWSGSAIGSIPAPMRTRPPRCPGATGARSRRPNRPPRVRCSWAGAWAPTASTATRPAARRRRGWRWPWTRRCATCLPRACGCATWSTPPPRTWARPNWRPRWPRSPAPTAPASPASSATPCWSRASRRPTPSAAPRTAPRACCAWTGTPAAKAAARTWCWWARACASIPAAWT